MATNKSDKPEDQPAQTQPMAAVPPIPSAPLDEVPWEGGGGRFIVNGRLVDHEGRPLNKDGSLKKEET